jgi:hypothetical protein
MKFECLFVIARWLENRQCTRCVELAKGKGHKSVYYQLRYGISEDVKAHSGGKYCKRNRLREDQSWHFTEDIVVPRILQCLYHGLRGIIISSPARNGLTPLPSPLYTGHRGIIIYRLLGTPAPAARCTFPSSFSFPCDKSAKGV